MATTVQTNTSQKHINLSFKLIIGTNEKERSPKAQNKHGLKRDRKTIRWNKEIRNLNSNLFTGFFIHCSKHVETDSVAPVKMFSRLLKTSHQRETELVSLI